MGRHDEGNRISRQRPRSLNSDCNYTASLLTSALAAITYDIISLAHGIVRSSGIYGLESRSRGGFLAAIKNGIFDATPTPASSRDVPDKNAEASS